MQTAIEATYPLSPLQQGMLFNSLYAPHSGVDIEQMLISLPEQLNVNAFSQAWQSLIDRHAVFRTGFRWQGLDQPRQDVYQQLPISLTQHDWTTLAPADQEKRLAAYLETDRRRGFDLTQAPLLRVALFRLGEASYRCLWTFHHILLDGRSFPLVLQELFALYQALGQGQTLTLPRPIPYRSYIDWLQQQDHAKSESFWRQMLQGLTAPTLFAVDRRPDEPVQAGVTHGEQEIHLAEALTTRLRTLAEQHGLTLNTFVQGAWATLLSRYSGEAEVLFGTTRACRRSSIEQAEAVVGLFINTVPLRVQVSPNRPLLAWLQDLRARQVALRPHEHTPLVKVQEWSEIPAGQPLFESLLVFENFTLSAAMKEQDGRWANRDIRLMEQTNYPLTLNGYAGSQLLLKISFDRQHFEDKVIERMLGHLQVLLKGMAANLEQPLANLPLLTEAERYQLLIEWNNTGRNYPQDVCLHHLFEAQVERTPEAIAISLAGEHLTYQDLNERANQLAHHLRGLGVGPEVLVGIFMERSIEMVISIYAVIKAGGAYVPLDPDYPPERVALMLEDAQVPVLLTRQKLVASLPRTEAQIICVDTEWSALATHSTANPASGVTAANLAYVIFTSGSTGRPKGVMNTHRGICNRLLWMQEAYQLAPDDRVLQKTPFSFDVSVWEFFWPLLVGARLVLAQPGGHQDRDYLVRLIIEQAITTLHFVPSMLQIFLEAKNVEQCHSLKRVICSGEALPYELQQRFFDRLTAELHNLYGPTEAAVDVTYWQCQRDSARALVPIGRPVANTQIYVLDPHLQPAPIGVPGELYIGGVQVARGYLNRPDLTAEKFIRDPFLPPSAQTSPSSTEDEGGRLYKTGDLARYLPDGAIEYLGRLDHQVKIRGFRIELGEIEAVLGQHQAIEKTAVVAIDTNQTANPKQLVAYIVPATAQTPSVNDLRTFLSKKLPDYMIPAAFVTLETIPLTPNGKINRRALPLPNLARPALEQSFVEPRNETEARLVQIWAEVLRVERVGVNDNFFDLGGHSLLATQVMARLQETFQVNLPLHTLFDAPTVAALAVMIVQKEVEHLADEELRQMLTSLETLSEDEVYRILKDDESLIT